jgi:hypothetical protein
MAYYKLYHNKHKFLHVQLFGIAHKMVLTNWSI